VEANLRGDKQPSFIDLFCGAGGFTWGWVRAGFAPLAAIDNDSAALRTHMGDRFRQVGSASSNASCSKAWTAAAPAS